MIDMTERPDDTARNRRGRKFRIAKLRHQIFTIGADRLTGGRLLRRHQGKPTVVRRFDVSMPEWPEAWNGLRVGHFSDMHFGDLMTVDQGRAVIDLLAAEGPDLVAFTGDMIDLECEGSMPLFEAIAGMQAPCGEFLVLGNHDLLDDGGRVVRMASDAGIEVLEDRVHEVPFDAWRADGAGPPLRVGGIDWDKTVPQLSGRVDLLEGERPSLLLAHNPKAFLPASRAGIPLTLSGHTHGGQIARPGRPELNLAVAHRLSAGFYLRDPSALFVTVGTGAWFPLRVHCPPEVVVLTCARGPLGFEER